ncbi:MAG: 2-amino-4-hydroxy-6-hydroxymethyldihydropteridine diphosphokinase [Vicinamibacterales bacterium]
MTRVAVALGSNLGDRRSHLDYAVTRLGEVLSALAVSSFVETDPEGLLPQPRYLNGAVVGETELTPRILLDKLLAIERERGRERPFPGAARTLDLDLILYGSEIVKTSGLVVPHPRFRERRFVLEPLAAIAPDLVDPVTGLTVSALLSRL